MLKQLYIKNFTLIDSLEIYFDTGFSVITGETGAGKSIILGALNLLLGQRADIKNVKPNTSKCIIEAHFDIHQYGMHDFFIKNDLDFDASDCILRREINSLGKSRAFINDIPVALGVIRELGSQLIDIHSQHQNLLLNEENFQLNVLDIIAGNKDLRVAYRTSFDNYKTAQKAVVKLRLEIDENKKNEDYLRFQSKELSEAGLKKGLQEGLEREREKLNHVEEIKTVLYSVENELNDTESDGCVLDKLRETVRSLDSIVDIYPEIKDISERIETCYVELKDISQEISLVVDGIEFDPERLEQINGQLDKIYSLEQKYHVNNIEALIELKGDVENRLNNIDNSEKELDKLEDLERKRFEECVKLAAELTNSRKKAAKTVESEMLERLVPLGIPSVRFSVEFDKKTLCVDGNDNVVFLFSANTNSPMQPFSQVASGGEIARVMLSLKAMISGVVKLPTIIFDEIDTGVSGKIAEKMASMMQEMAKSDRQVISITHLPQIAAKGSTHYKVYKEETDTGTISRMFKLDKEERIDEIAQMLSGTEVSAAAIRNAKELLKQYNHI